MSVASGGGAGCSDGSGEIASGGGSGGSDGSGIVPRVLSSIPLRSFFDEELPSPMVVTNIEALRFYFRDPEDWSGSKVDDSRIHREVVDLTETRCDHVVLSRDGFPGMGKMLSDWLEDLNPNLYVLGSEFWIMGNDGCLIPSHVCLFETSNKMYWEGKWESMPSILHEGELYSRTIFEQVGLHVGSIYEGSYSLPGRRLGWLSRGGSPISLSERLWSNPSMVEYLESPHSCDEVPDSKVGVSITGFKKELVRFLGKVNGRCISDMSRSIRSVVAIKFGDLAKYFGVLNLKEWPSYNQKEDD